MERVRKRQIVLVLCAAVVVLFYITPVHQFQAQYHLQSAAGTTPSAFKQFCPNFNCLSGIWGSLTESTKYLVHTSTCRIIDMDPFHKSVKKFLKPANPMKCKKALVTLKDQTLKIDEVLSKNWKYVGPTCCYRELNRVTQKPTNYNKDADWTVSLSTKCRPIGKNGTEVKVPFVKIECKNELKVKSSVDFQTVLLPPKTHSKETAKKVKAWDKASASGQPVPPSVLIIGIDSISRLHMKRELQETLQFLNTHDFVEMRGYTKIGENTFPNMMGAIGGMRPDEYPCWPSHATKLDDCPFIWKNFSGAGYVTAFLEDAPGLAIFNYEKTGFVTAPTDYYIRPVMAASHLYDRRSKSSGTVSCFGGLSPTDYIAKYIKGFVKLHGSQYPYFLLSWFTSIGHDDFNGLKTGDPTFLSLLKEGVTGPGANNTVILFISDHGYRFGAFRETFMGFYEESLPFFYIRLPEDLKARFPHWYQNLKENSGRLTTPLDLHSTLSDILDLAAHNASAGPNGTEPDYPSRSPAFRERYSFFERAHTNRTCESSAIPQRYCMCGVTPEVGRTSDKSKSLARFMIDRINDLVLGPEIAKGACQRLSFSKVLYGREAGVGEIWNNFGALVRHEDFVVAFETKPGEGHFEGRVRIFENGTQTLVETVSRINSYKGQSDCMSDYVLKNYCMCHTKKV